LQLIGEDEQLDDAVQADCFQRLQHGNIANGDLLPEESNHDLLGHELLVGLFGNYVLEPEEEFILIILSHHRLGDQDVPDLFNLLGLQLQL